jgi:hypothetical protein
MSSEIKDLVVVYWSIETKRPIYNFANENIENIDEFAKLVVPEGIHYNIVHKDEVNQKAVPGLKKENLTDSEYESLFYHYLNNL